MNEVPKMEILLNSLCNLFLVQVDHNDHQVFMDWDVTMADIADTLTEIASQGVQEVKDAEPTSEDKLIHGIDMALPLLRFFKNGNRNLKAIMNSQVPQTIC
jgi:hypothetical protein